MSPLTLATNHQRFTTNGLITHRYTNRILEKSDPNIGDPTTNT
jgi:energy-converting hydrogenase Eha subunit A